MNNLPKGAGDALVRRARPGEQGVAVLPHWMVEGLRQRAAERGYANSFEALRASVPWRPQLGAESAGRTERPGGAFAGPPSGGCRRGGSALAWRAPPMS